MRWSLPLRNPPEVTCVTTGKVTEGACVQILHGGTECMPRQRSPRTHTHALSDETHADAHAHPALSHALTRLPR